jgi:hypothetical protein
MLVVQLTCPHCVHILRCKRLIAPGERLRCPHCGVSFRAGIDGPPNSGAPIAAEPVRGPGILLAWMLFAALLLFVGGGFAIAVKMSNRSRSDESPTRVAEEVKVGPTEQAPPSERIEPPVPDVPAPPASDIPPSPPAAPPRDVKVDPPPPPPLPPPPREVPRPTPPKARPAEPEKPRAPAPTRREAPQVRWLPAHVQRQVDRSVDNGVEYLRRQQHADGSWGHQTGTAGKRFTPGITALSGLTLLECGVPAKDPQVRSVAKYLRQRMPELTTTYSISLALLFFDRLDDKDDAARIRTLALRLIAGQKPSGGWDYYCPTLREDEELGLLALLYKDRPTTSADLFAAEPRRPAVKLDGGLYRPRPSTVPPLDLFVAQESVNPPSRDRQGAGKAPLPNGRGSDHGREEEPAHPKDKVAEKSPALPGDNRRLSKRALDAADKLPEALRQTPALRAAELMRDLPDVNEPRTDNSNTQFGILGLLTAENHDVPLERAMALLDWRFRNSPTVQGGWNYRLNLPTTPAMTAAALMGLALKHGLLLPNRRERGRNVIVHDDEIMHRGFLTLTGLLEHYFAGFVFNQARLDKLDLYCLWTVERVAVLYNLRTMGTLEWYPSGVQLLLPLQREDGSWSSKGTTCLDEPSVATAFALLFLKRSNLARNLTDRLGARADE